MTQEVEKSHHEAPATHKKNAQTYGLVVAAIIAVALIIQALIASNNVKDPVNVNNELNEPAVRPEKHNNFGDRFNMEQQRILSERNKKKEDPITVENIMDQQQEKTAQLERSYNQFMPTDTKTKDPYEEWQQSEQLRVWNARRSPFNVRLVNKTASKNTRQVSRSPYNHVSMNKKTEGLTKLDKERLLVQERLKSVQDQIALSKGRNLGATAFNSPINYFGKSNSIGNMTNRFSSSPGGNIVVGQPESESKPKPGELLLPTSTVIRAALESKSISDYTGSFKAQIMDDVYDVSGEYILIPKGSKVDGRIIRISNVNEPIQNRLGMLTRWIVLPNGKRISLEKASPLDTEGVGAFSGDVNYHLFAQFMGVAAYALVANNGSRDGTSYTEQSSYRGEITQGAKDQLAPLAQKYLSLVPTVTLHRGTPMRIYIEDDIYAKPWSKVVAGLLPAF